MKKEEEEAQHIVVHTPTQLLHQYCTVHYTGVHTYAAAGSQRHAVALAPVWPPLFAARPAGCRLAMTVMAVIALQAVRSIDSHLNQGSPLLAGSTL